MVAIRVTPLYILSVVLASILIGAGLAYLFLFQTNELPSSCLPGFSCPYGLVYRDSEISFPGYTLINPRRGRSHYLIDWEGKLVRTWTIPGLPSPGEIGLKPELIGFLSTQAKLLPNGNILIGHGGSEAVPYSKPDGSSIVFLNELDWNGKLLWEYRNELGHHDFERLPDGRTAMIVWEKIPKELQIMVKGGIPRSEYNGEMYSDAIIEVDRDGQEVWRWSLWQHLDPNDSQNRLDSGVTRNAWTNTDAVKYLEKNPFTGTPAYLVSISKLDSLALVDRQSGEIIRRWGSRILASPHSVDITERNTVITFDMGVWRSHIPESRKILPGRYSIQYSRVIETDFSQIVDSYAPGPFITMSAAIFTPINGTVQALPNSNILVSTGIKGRIFEFDPKSRQVVWDYINPFGLVSDGWPTLIDNGIYSAYRYPYEYINF